MMKRFHGRLEYFLEQSDDLEYQENCRKMFKSYGGVTFVEIGLSAHEENIHSAVAAMASLKPSYVR